MGFREDYVANAMAMTIKDGTFANVVEKIKENENALVAPVNESEFCMFVAICLEHAKIVKMRSEQAEVFLGLDSVPDQDRVQWLRMPFDSLYIDLSRSIVFPNYIGDDGEKGGSIRAVHITEIPGEAVASAYVGGENRGILGAFAENSVIEESRLAKLGRIVRNFRVLFFMPVRSDITALHATHFSVLTDNSIHVNRDGNFQPRERMMLWTIHAINFLTSPSVKLEKKHVNQALQKARQHKGKSPLPGWYEINYSRRVISIGKLGHESGFHHGFRYDVRGNFASHTRGRLAGRVIWRPAHQRGLTHDLYKPKAYKI